MYSVNYLGFNYHRTDFAECFFFRLFGSSFLPRCMEYRSGLAIRILSVCSSVCPSVKRVDCDKTKEFQICPDIYTVRKII